MIRRAAVLTTALGLKANGQYGGVDPTFNPIDDGTYGDGPVKHTSPVFDYIPSVERIEAMPGGGLLLSGDFQAYNDHPTPGITKVNVDGTVDAAFQPGYSSGSIASMAVLPDGRILLGGEFAFVAQPTVRLMRLHPDGQIDETFDPGTGPNAEPTLIVRHPDGRLLLAGGFTSYAGVPRQGLALIHPDGSLDLTFDPGTGVDGIVLAACVQSNGHILIGGSFTQMNGLARRGIARLTPDGLVDSFDPASGTSGTVHSLAVDDTGRIYAGGQVLHMQGGTP